MSRVRGSLVGDDFRGGGVLGAVHGGFTGGG